MSLMAREIRDQPETLRRTIASLTPRIAEVRDLVGACAGARLYARGSSDTAAVYGRYLFEVEAGVPSALGAPSVATLYGRRLDLRDTLVVLLSQSGETAEIVQLACWARSCGAATVGITNVRGSALTRAVDRALVTEAGPELAIPATKTHSAQLVALVVLAAALLDPAGARPLLDGLARVPDEAALLLESSAAGAADAFAAQLAEASALVFAGRGYTLATALELALKAEETCRLPCSGLSAADLQHGPSAVLGPSVPLVVVAPPAGPALASLAAVAAEARRRSAPVFTIGGDRDLPEPLSPIAGVIFGQLVVEALARRLGVDPDHPAGLAKVTRTV